MTSHYQELVYTVLLEGSVQFSRLSKKFANRGNSFLRTSRGQFAGSKSGGLPLMSKRLHEKARPKTVYIASPLGFPGEGAEKRLKLKADIENRVKGLGHKILDPWRHTEYGPEIDKAFGMSWHPMGQRQAFKKISNKIAKNNEADMDKADAILAVYHQAPQFDAEELKRARMILPPHLKSKIIEPTAKEIDAGTVGELNYMHGKGKRIKDKYIYRDAGLKDVGDFPGQYANLQAKHGAKKTFRKVKDINF